MRETVLVIFISPATIINLLLITTNILYTHYSGYFYWPQQMCSALHIIFNVLFGHKNYMWFYACWYILYYIYDIRIYKL